MFEQVFVIFGKVSKSAAAHGFHDPDGDIAFGEELITFLCILECPIQVIELNLAEFHVRAGKIEEVFEMFVAAMGRKPEVFDASESFLFDKVSEYVPLRVAVDIDGGFADVMEEIEVKILDLTFFELFFKNFGRVIGIGVLVSRVFAGQIIAVSWVFAQNASSDDFGHTAVIGVSRIEVIDAILDGIVEDRRGVVFVDGAVWQCGQAHHTEAET